MYPEEIPVFEVKIKHEIIGLRIAIVVQTAIFWLKGSRHIGSGEF
jgi:hypothetical protein